MIQTTDPVRMQETQIREVSAVLARAFFDDPMTRYILPDDERRARALPAGYTCGTRYGHLYGEVYTTDGSVEGAAIWLPPGETEIGEERMVAAGLAEMAAQLGEEAMARFGAIAAHLDELHRRDVPDPHWYLFILGVDPPRQGRGIGGQLMQPVLARADAAGLPCYLETMKARNVPFYRKHGFGVVVEADLPGGGLHFWTMRRSPRR
jgi:GNAT superfamily N-acetyltransferase